MMSSAGLRREGAARKLKVFVSYSRRDIDFADRLADALHHSGLEVLIDRRDLPLLERWREELLRLIRTSDVTVAILTPSFLQSRWCEWEVEQVKLLRKRLAPVVAAALPRDLPIPEAISSLNYVYFTAPHDFTAQVTKLVAALNTNIEWVKEHTRLGEIALRWKERGRASELLLRGNELEEADRWAVARPLDAPALSETQMELIQASRKSHSRRQRNWIAGTLGVASFASVLAGVAYWQRGIAVQNESVAIDQRNQALTAQSRFLADRARQAFNAGKSVRGALLALEGLPDTSLIFARPRVAASEHIAFVTHSEQREELVLNTGNETALSIALSPDGRHLAANVMSGVLLRYLENGAPYKTLTGKGAVFSPDSKRLLTISGATATVWDIETGTELVTLEGHEHVITCAKFSPDGQSILTTSNDNTARIWDANSGRERVVFRGHQEVTRIIEGNGTMFRPDDEEITVRGVNVGAFSPDSKKVVTGGEDGTARIWDAVKGTELLTLPDSGTNGVVDVSFSPDGQRVLTASVVPRLWSSESGTNLATLEGHKGRLLTMSFSSNGKLIVTTGEDGDVRLWDGFAGLSTALLKGHSDQVNAAAFTHNDAQLVSASSDGTVRIWDVGTRSNTAILAGHDDRVWSVAFSADGSRFATSSSDRTARIWRIRRISELPNAAESGSADGTSDATPKVGADKTLVPVWDLQRGRIVRVFPGVAKELGWRAAFSPDGQLLVTESGDNIARVRNSATGEVVQTLTGHTHGKAEDPGKIALALAEQDPDHRIETTYDQGIPSVAFSPDGQEILTTSVDRTARVWNARSGETITILSGHEDRIGFGAFSPQGSRIVTVSDDGTARIWNAATGKTTATLQLSPYGGVVAGEAAFSPDGTRLVTTSPKVRLWDVETGSEIAAIDVAVDVTAVAFSPDGRVLALAVKGRIVLWDIEAGATIGELQTPDTILRLGFTLDGQSLVAAIRDGSHVWRTFRSTQELVEQIKRAAPRCLTLQEREEAYLPPTPPRWCITGPGLEQEADPAKWKPKWPYDTPEWRDRLARSDGGVRTESNQSD